MALSGGSPPLGPVAKGEQRGEEVKKEDGCEGLHLRRKPQVYRDDSAPCASQESTLQGPFL